MISHIVVFMLYASVFFITFYVIYYMEIKKPIIEITSYYVHKRKDVTGTICSDFEKTDNDDEPEIGESVSNITEKNCFLNGTIYLHQTDKCCCKQNVVGENCDKCKYGYLNMYQKDPLGCSGCFCYKSSPGCEPSSFKYVIDNRKPNIVFDPLNEQTNNGYIIYNYTRGDVDYYVIVHSKKIPNTCEQRKLEVYLTANTKLTLEAATVKLKCDHNFKYPELVSHISWFMDDTLIDKTTTRNTTLTLTKRNVWCELNLKNHAAISSNVIPIKNYFEITSVAAYNYILLTCDTRFDLQIVKYEWLRNGELLEELQLKLLNAFFREDRILILDPRNSRSLGEYKCRAKLKDGTVWESGIFNVQLDEENLLFLQNYPGLYLYIFNFNAWLSWSTELIINKIWLSVTDIKNLSVADIQYYFISGVFYLISIIARFYNLLYLGFVELSYQVLTLYYLLPVYRSEFIRERKSFSKATVNAVGIFSIVMLLIVIVLLYIIIRGFIIQCLRMLLIERQNDAARRQP